MSQPLDPRNWVIGDDTPPPPPPNVITPPAWKPPPPPEPNPPPHAPGIEKAILSIVFQFPERAAGLTPDLFHLPAHREILTQVLALPGAFDLSIFAQRLNDLGLLERVGGPGALADIYNYQPTDLQFDDHLAILSEKAAARTALTQARALIEEIEGNPGESLDIITRINRELAKAAGQAAGKDSMIVRGVLDYPTEVPAEVCLLGNGWMRRGDIVTFVSTAGAGKSVAVTQAAMAWGLGRAYMGIKPQQPLRILMFCGEDDHATIGQIREGFREHASQVTRSPVTDKLFAVLNMCLRTEFSREYVGDAFHAHLDRLLTQEPADLVIINPLMSYIGGEIVSLAPTWLRIGLMPLLQKHDCGCLIAHHTRVMAKDGWDNTDDIYAAIGGSEMANIPRATLTMRPTPADGVIVAKVGKRTSVGWKSESGKFVTDYFMRRSDNAERPAWLPIPYDEAISLMESGGSSTNKRGPTPRTSEIKTALIEDCSSGPILQSALIDKISAKLGVSDRTVRNALTAAVLSDQSLVTFSEKNPNGGKPVKWVCLPENLPPAK